MPGSGVETSTEEEASLVAALVAAGRSAAEIEAALADLRSRRVSFDPTDGRPGVPATGVPPRADGVTRTGTLSGPPDVLAALKPAELAFANELVAAGYDVAVVPTGPDQTPDFNIDGLAHELKTVSGSPARDESRSSGVISNRILGAASQSATVVIDARDQPGMSRETALRGIIRANGNLRERELPEIGPGGRVVGVLVLTPDGRVQVGDVMGGGPR